MQQSGTAFDSAIHPAWLRIAHWLNVLAVVVMATSGWRIYNAAPFFDLRFPPEITLGGWLAGALQWHFAAMWLLVVNGLIYLTLNLASGRLVRKFLPLDAGGVWRDLRVLEAGAQAGVAVTPIGHIAAGDGLTVLDEHGHPLDLSGLHAFDHFAG